MKKIVALVLSLAMVLAMATTAFAATSYEGLYLVDANDPESVTEVTLTTVKAVAPKYDKVTKLLANEPAIAHYVDDAGVTYVTVSKLADADFVAYVDADCKVVKFYLDAVEFVNYVEGAAFTNFGEKCGQYAVEPAEDAKYVTLKGMDDDKAVYVIDKEGDAMVKVGAEFVTISTAPVATVADIVAHQVVTESEDGEFTKVYCGACKVQAVKAANVLSIPEGAVVAIDGTTWYWTNTVAAEDTETVESAKTFDAGIAMYVGMSVMAAAGSAVVLKKKD